MDILISIDQPHDHELYQKPWQLISSTDVFNLDPGIDYLITDPEVADFFCGVIFKYKESTIKHNVIVDQRTAAQCGRARELIHYKLLHPQITVLGDFWNRGFKETVAKATQTNFLPHSVIEHISGSRLEWPVLDNNDHDIIVVGCSFTYGAGLADPGTESYSAILEEKLNRPVKNFGISGSSIEYAAKILELLNLNSTNIVVWQLTGLLRWIEPAYKPYTRWLPNYTLPFPVHYIPSRQDKHQLNKSKINNNSKIIKSTISKLRATCPFVILDVGLYSPQVKIPEITELVPYVDSGTDRCTIHGELFLGHPGPGTHQNYAAAVLAKLTELYQI